MAPARPTRTSFGQTLRGREVLVLIDSVPMNTNRNLSRDLFNITPANIECIEVVHGGSSVYGGGGAGGFIYINTPKPQEGPPTRDTTVSGSTSLALIDDDALSRKHDQQLSGNSGGSDYHLPLASASRKNRDKGNGVSGHDDLGGCR